MGSAYAYENNLNDIARIRMIRVGMYFDRINWIRPRCDTDWQFSVFSTVKMVSNETYFYVTNYT